jgi:hypothetical protein
MFDGFTVVVSSGYQLSTLGNEVSVELMHFDHIHVRLTFEERRLFDLKLFEW